MEEHEKYRAGYTQLTAWLQDTKERVDAIGAATGTQEELKEKQASIEEIMEEKDAGFEQLAVAVEAGERLYPDTATTGRDKIRQQLRTAKHVWDNLISEATDKQRQISAALVQLSAYHDNMEEIQQWLAQTGDVVDASLKELHNTLPEKRSALHASRGTLTEVTSYGRVVAGLVDRADAAYRTSRAGDLPARTAAVRDAYAALETRARDAVTRLEHATAQHGEYAGARAAAGEWMALMGDRLRLADDTSGDRHAIANRLERVQVQCLANLCCEQ